jgi:hypothetical protein
LNNRYQLELLQGAGSINQTSDQETIWGVPVVQTTQQAAGTAAVLSVQSGAAVVYVREALTTFFDPYSQASSNIYQYKHHPELSFLAWNRAPKFSQLRVYFWSCDLRSCPIQTQ